MISRYRVHIIFETEFHSTDGGIFGKLKSNICKEPGGAQIASRLGDIVCDVYKLLSLLDEGSVLFLPRRVGSGGVQIFLPGSSVKGVFRHALDLYGIEQVLERHGDNFEHIEEEIRENLIELGVDKRRVDTVASALTFISEWSWLLTTWGDVPIEGVSPGDLRSVHVRQKLERLVEGARGGQSVKTSRKHALGLSELVFGITGLRSAVRFYDFSLICDDPSYVKTYIAIASARKVDTEKVANPFRMELLPPGATFEGVVEVVGNPLVSEEDVREALEKAVEVINSYRIGFGKRKSASFGRAKVELIENKA